MVDKGHDFLEELGLKLCSQVTGVHFYINFSNVNSMTFARSKLVVLLGYVTVLLE